MPVSGVIIRIDPECSSRVTALLRAEHAVELQEASSPELLVAVLDTSSFAAETALVEKIARLPGIKNVALAYHNFEDMTEAAALPEERRVS